MVRQLILQTSLSECRLEVFQGVEIVSRYQQFAQIITRKLGPERLLVLAEPVVDKAADRINWYAGVSGEVKSFAHLSLAEQGQALTDIGQRETEINQLAQALKDAGDSNSVLAGELLGRLFTRPNNQGLFMVGGQPVLAAWGLRSGLAAAEAVVLEEERRAAAPPPPPPPPLVTTAAPRKGCRTWWLLLLLAFLFSALLSFLLLYFLFPRFRPGLTGRVTPPALDQPAFDRNHDQAEESQRELARLKKNYQERQAQCPPLESPAAKPDDLKPPPSEQEEARPLEIPEKAAENNDLSFLEGCWQSVTGLYNTKSGLPVIYLYCFDKNGLGTVEIQERDAQGGLIQTCRSQAEARFAEEALIIKEDGPECPDDKSRYSPSEVSCVRGEGGLAACDGLQKNPQTRKTNKWAAQFKRHPKRP